MTVLLAVHACSRRAPPPTRGEDASAGGDPIGVAIERAEDVRRASEVPAQAAQGSRDPSVRRLAARAFARILGDDDGPLLRAVEDDDEETVAWAAFGLGEACAGREGAHVRVLASRVAFLDEPGSVAGPLDTRVAILRALGRCGGDLAEQTLRQWPVRRGGQSLANEAAAYALGELAAKRGSLSAESAAVLLDAAEGTPPLDAALYAFGRVDSWAGGDLVRRALLAARAALARTGPERVFAVRALGRSGSGEATADLAGVVSSNDFTPAERAEAAHGLARLHEAGQLALAVALGALLTDGAAAASGDRFGVLLSALDSVSDVIHRAPSNSVLSSVTRVGLAAGAAIPTARRVSELRCAAARKLVRGAWDAPILTTCDLGDGQAAERARLAALDHGPLLKTRRAAFVALALRIHSGSACAKRPSRRSAGTPSSRARRRGARCWRRRSARPSLASSRRRPTSSRPTPIEASSLHARADRGDATRASPATLIPTSSMRSTRRSPADGARTSSRPALRSSTPR